MAVEACSGIGIWEGLTLSAATTLVLRGWSKAKPVSLREPELKSFAKSIKSTPWRLCCTS